MKNSLLLLAMIVCSQSFGESYELTRICAYEGSLKEITLIEGLGTKPCEVLYQGKVKWRFWKDFSKCGKAVDQLTMILEKQGYLCFASDSQKN